jgi:hypothetical protein
MATAQIGGDIMLDTIRKFFRKREARDFSENATGWHAVCQTISEMYVEVLHDDNPTRSDIGVVLDKTDRMLFALRDHLSALRPPLNRRDRELTKRVNKASEHLYELRNKTARFLIRAQGHTPTFMREGTTSPEVEQTYYLKAMQEVGFDARQAALALRKELKGIWEELFPLVSEADQLIRE